MSYEIQGDRITNSNGSGPVRAPLGVYVSDGSAPVPAGSIGELVSTAPIGGTTITYSNATPVQIGVVGSLTLTAGVWHIVGQFDAYSGFNTGGSAIYGANVDIYDSTDSTEIYVSPQQHINADPADNNENFYASAYFRCSSTKTVQVRIIGQQVVGTPTGFTFVVRAPSGTAPASSTSNSYQSIYAIRVG